MFGLISKSKHNKQIEELNSKLELEKIKSIYWKLKCLSPECEPVICGSAEQIDYIRGSEVNDS